MSWESRRLALLQGLPDGALAEVCAGRLSSWAAMRMVLPLARANGGHAERLLAALRGAPLSTRELGCWFEQYRQAGRAARERIVNQPRLLLDASRASGARRVAEHLDGGPEGKRAADLRNVTSVLARLERRVARLRQGRASSARRCRACARRSRRWRRRSRGKMTPMEL